MKKLLATVTAVGFFALTWSPSYADNATTTVETSGSAAPMCNADTTLATTFNLGGITSVTTSKILDGGVSKLLSLGAVTCSTDAFVSIKSAKGHLAIGTPTPAECIAADATAAICIDYQADAAWNGTRGVTASLATGTNGTTAQYSTSAADAAANAALTLDITIPYVNKPVHAGTFSDSITIQVGSKL